MGRRNEFQAQMDNRLPPRTERLRKFGVDTNAGTERFNLLYSDAFRRAEDRRIEVERQETVRQRKTMLVSVHAAAQLKPWTQTDIKEVTHRLHQPRRTHSTWQNVLAKGSLGQEQIDEEEDGWGDGTRLMEEMVDSSPWKHSPER